MRLVPLLLALPLLLTACSDSKGSAGPDPLPTGSGPAGCPTAGATEIPASCAPSEPPEARPSLPTNFPKTSAAIEAVTIPAGPKDLARGGNDVDPALTTRTFDVTVPAGERLSVVAACNGATFLQVATVPDSQAEMDISCFAPNGISELGVSDSVFQKAATTFKVTVTTQAPSRWFAVVGSTKDALPADAG